MVMPARVADAHRVADVLCGEDAAGMQPSLRLAPQNNAALSNFWSVLFTPG